MEEQVLRDCQRPVQGVLLGDHTDQLFGPRRVGDDVDSGYVRLAGRGDDPGREHARCRGLSAPFGPRSPKISRGCTTRSSRSTAAKSAPGYTFVSCEVLMISPPARGADAIGAGSSTTVIGR